jgi:hypothetical protein
MDPQLKAFFEILREQNLSKESVTKILWTQPSLIKYFVMNTLEDHVEANAHWISTLLTGVEEPQKYLQQLEKNGDFNSFLNFKMEPAENLGV